jgi:hypothetical protein
MEEDREVTGNRQHMGWHERELEAKESCVYNESSRRSVTQF